MNFVSCVKWIKKGVAQNVPESINLNEEELKNLIEEPEDEQTQETSSRERDSIDDEYEMEKYDAEDDHVRPSFKDIVDFSDPGTNKSKKKKKKKNKLKKRTDDDDLSDEEREDEIIKDDDNLLLVGHVNDDLSTIDVYVYNENNGDMYIHHDMMLKSAPLCVEWLNIETASGPTNLCAVGSMNPVIELWDLDIINCVEPTSKLGRFKKKKNPEKNFGHTDAVLSVAWNSELPHIFCSGSVDKSVLLWDLETGKVATEINVFTDKVQNVLWNPHSEYHLLTGCADGVVRNFDCRLYDEYKSFNLNDSIESILWNPNNEYCCYAGTETGDIYALDFRSTVPLFQFSAHKKEVTGLAIDKSDPKTLISVSTDQRLKLWKIRERGPKLLYEEDHKLEAIHCIDTNPDYPQVVCIGGSSERSYKNIVKVINVQNCREAKKLKQGVNETSVSLPPLPAGVALLEDDEEKKRKIKSPKSNVKKKRKKNVSTKTDD